MKIRLFGIEQESVVDGEGVRLAIFTQGCPHHCAGCHNPGSHNPIGGYEKEIDEIVPLMDDYMLQGITLTGGEPFMQIDACVEIIKRARSKRLDVWCYTGYDIEEIMSDPDKMRLLKNVDVLVDGKFILSQKSYDLRFKGSKNQRVINVRETLKDPKCRIILQE